MAATAPPGSTQPLVSDQLTFTTSGWFPQFLMLIRQSDVPGGVSVGYSPANRVGSRFVEVTVIGSAGKLMR